MSRILEWDSAFWGVTVAEVTDPDCDAWAAAHAVACAYLTVADFAEVHRAEEAGFRLMDVRVVYAGETAPTLYPRATPASADQVDALARIARAAHTATRFYADPRLPDRRCADLYETWISRSCAGWADQVLTCSIAVRPVGYITLHREPGSGRVGLVAVAAPARGVGIGTALVEEALAWCYREGLGRMTVATQASNVAAQNLLQSCGLRPAETKLILHRWWDR